MLKNKEISPTVGRFCKLMIADVKKVLRKRFGRSLLLFLLLIGVLGINGVVQAQKEIDPAEYTKTGVNNGAPVLSDGEKMDFKFTNPAYAAINEKGNYKGIYLLIENYKRDDTDIWLLEEKADTSISLSQITFDKLNIGKNENFYYSQHILEEADYMLNLLWDNENNIFYFNWSEIKANK